MADKIRRIVTGHAEDGTAVFTDDELFDTVVIPSGDAAFRTIWTTLNVPADLNDETDGAKRNAGLTLNGGSVIRIVDMLPNCSSPMHRSSSIDYGIILSGQIELELDNQDVKTLGQGLLLFSVVPSINGVIQAVPTFAASYLSSQKQNPISSMDNH